MKKHVGVVVLAAVVAASAAILSVQAASKPEKGIIVGDVIELSTYAMKGHTEESKSAYRLRAEHGFPVGIIDEDTGEVWVCVYRDPAPAAHLKLANNYMVDLMGKKAVVQGLKYKAKGVNLIRISVISEY